MKKTLTAAGSIPVSIQGESYKALWGYFYPELITAFLLYTALTIIDGRFIALLGNSSAYATLGVTDTLVHFIMKIADGFSVGMVVLSGQYNGIGAYHRTGKTVTDAFWITALLGACVAVLLYFGAFAVYRFYEVPQEMVTLGVPYLRLRAIGIFLNFAYFALIGFLRGVKNTRVPMVLFVVGSLFFLFFDYVLIFGAWGFPALGLQGSAMAFIIQYAVMLIGALWYIGRHAEYRKYAITFFSPVHWQTIKSLLHLSWPVMIDKASFALCYIWLAKMVACMAKGADPSCIALPTYSFMKFALQVLILPGIAFAQVVTFLVSNDYKAQNWQRIKVNITRALVLSTGLVLGSLSALLLWPRFFLSFFDKTGSYTDFAAAAIPFMGMMVFFDLVQVILSAALRGACQMRRVMVVRVVVIGLYFIPTSYIISQLPIDNLLVKFILVYGSMYIGNAIMSLIYLHHFKGDDWKGNS